ncbi:DNA/RNA non-specific endonuclease [Butyrivibrio sp. AE3004]|uniref:DNA/RNA non-specific endonuclease n=1 Tax=Butyrivibrio sp. AE3004 TaxID=1506994 RepID=UPI000494CF1A|nr:DNA/RNA non-specific endonuclease [Butyrivibrio sp. AE3004]
MKKRDFLKNKIWIPVIAALVISVCSVSVLGVGETTKTAAESAVVAEIPAYSGRDNFVLNDNVPVFTSLEITGKSYEKYGELDDLGRCTPAMASIGKDLMPAEERGSIAEVKPSGWNQNKYPGLVNTDPPFLYNRCHMIGYQLTGENANERNLITGTRYMNEAMIPYENEVADYIRNTGNHVMYRVTPVFDGDNLLCDGLQVEAMSVEDKGKGVSFNVFFYNVQPGVFIDYKDGSNKPDKNYRPENNESENNESDNGTRSSVETTQTYIGNKNSHVFHRPDCDSVSDMKEKNKVMLEGTPEEIENQGFRPCQRCHPKE